MKSNSITLVLAIGNQALKGMKNLDNKPYLGLTQLNFKVETQQSNLDWASTG